MITIKNILSSLVNKYKFSRQKRTFRKVNKELLFKVDDALNRAGLTYWLNYGTLLGAYRDHSFIPHDYDMDIGMYWEDREQVVELLTSAGLKFEIEYRTKSWENPDCMEYRSSYKGAFIDINFTKVMDNKAYSFFPAFLNEIDYLQKNIILPVVVEGVVSPFKGLKKIDFLGRPFNVPVNTEEYLIANYGESYMTPISNFDYHDYASNLTIYSREEMPGFFKRY